MDTKGHEAAGLIAESRIEPASVDELVEAVHGHARVLAVGAGTKSRLAALARDWVRVSTARLSGIIEYEPSEFTFTALAGTPVKEIVRVLGERGQYLPFDPLLADAGATLGGTVAAGLSGPGRFRYGGLRDFILGVKFVDGEGRLLRLGGRVVKNAAGFDVPKFFVGSAGRFGVMAEITFKVFPRPATLRTLRLAAKDAAEKARIFSEAARARWELDALDAALEEPAVYARIGGPAEALDALGAEVLGRFKGETMTAGDANYLWQSVVGFRWAHAAGSLVKLAITPTEVTALAAALRNVSGVRGWLSAGGNVAYLSLPAGAALPDVAWPGVRLRGDGTLWVGPRREFEVMRRVKAALDPAGRFPGLSD